VPVCVRWAGCGEAAVSGNAKLCETSWYATLGIEMEIHWTEITDDREKYAAYLCSREWSVLKQAVHDRAYGLCERCHTRKIDAVHHLTYARKYAEDVKDLQGLCKGCHEFTHAKSSVDPCDVEEREGRALRVFSRQGDLYVDLGDYVCSLDASIAISVWKGLCTAEDVRSVVEHALRIGQQMRDED